MAKKKPSLKKQLTSLQDRLQQAIAESEKVQKENATVFGEKAVEPFKKAEAEARRGRIEAMQNISVARQGRIGTGAGTG